MLQLAEQLAQASDNLDLGHARVLADARGRLVRLRLESGEEAEAMLALAMPYAAREDDVVLVLSKGDRHYVVGLLDGAGVTDLAFRGDVNLRAVGGSLRLSADEGVEMSAPKLSVAAKELEMVASSVVQRFRSLTQRVQGLVSLRAERMTTKVDDTAHTSAKRATILTEQEVVINGEQVRLG